MYTQDLFGSANESFAASDTDSCLQRQTPFANTVGQTDADASVLFVSNGKASLKEYDVSLLMTITMPLHTHSHGRMTLLKWKRCPYPKMGSSLEASKVF